MVRSSFVSALALAALLVALYGPAEWNMPDIVAIPLFALLLGGLLLSIVILGVGLWRAYEDRSEALVIYQDTARARYNLGSGTLEISWTVHADSSQFRRARCTALLGETLYELQAGTIQNHVTVQDRHTIPFSIELERLPENTVVTAELTVQMRSRFKRTAKQELTVALVGTPPRPPA